MSRTEANKFQKYTAKMRTDMDLINRSKRIPDYLASAIEDEIAHYLVQRKIIYPQKLQKLGFNEETSYQDKKQILDVTSRPRVNNINEDRFNKFMQQASDVAKNAKWRFRISQEAQEKHEMGWYPFFVTITVDPKIIDSKIMWQKGREWQKLLRRLSTIVTGELGHKPFWKKPYRPITDYLTYAAVIEHGKSREHHHLHTLIWFREIPSSWKLCPNRHCSAERRVHNNCRPLETYWKLGICDAKYFRSVGDIWEIKHNFVLPLKDGKPMKVSTPAVAGAYLTKYMQKDKKEWQHRMKATRNLGLTKLKSLIIKMNLETIQALTWRPNNPTLCHFLSTTHTVPLGLIRQLAKQEHFYRQYTLKAQSIRELMMIQSKPYIKMLRSVRNGARPDRMAYADFYDWLSQHLNAQPGYCEERLKKAHSILSFHYKRQKDAKLIKIGGNSIGFT